MRLVPQRPTGIRLTKAGKDARHNPEAPLPEHDRKVVLDIAREALDKYIAWERSTASLREPQRFATTAIASAVPPTLGFSST